MKKILLVLAVTILACAAVLFAHDEHDGKPITLVGQVVDTGCYIHHDSKGAEHADCAKMCAKAGVPLAILDDKGKLYLPIATDHKNQNLKLMPFIEKKVKITGLAFDKGGLAGVSIKTIELAQ
jgi:hypothetical protein